MNTHTRSGFTATLLMLTGMFGLNQLLLDGQAALQTSGLIIASKRTNQLVITITSPDGRLKGGENSFCVMFEKKGTREPMDVENVSVDFTLLVGRIQEEPIRAHLTKDQKGHYCGHVDLGKQYYIPASYYAFVFYTDASGQERKARLFLSVK
jgi:hypothetical protein